MARVIFLEKVMIAGTRPLMRHRGIRWAACLSALVAANFASAAATDISKTPLVSSSGTVVKPNVMFVLDDSGSMGYDYLPDDASFSVNYYGRRSYHCNGVAYHPIGTGRNETTKTYALPLDYTGAELPAGSMSFLSDSPGNTLSNIRTVTPASQAIVSTGTITLTVNSTTVNTNSYPVGRAVTLYDLNDASHFIVASVSSWNATSKSLQLAVQFSAGSGTIGTMRIGDSIPANVYMKYTGSQTDWAYYNATGTLDTTTTFYQECNSLLGATPGKPVFTPVVVTASSSEAANFANWFKYYRTRMAMMKSSVSRAFKGLDSRYRVGYSTILEKGAADGTNFLNIRDFDTTQKQSFYTAFNAATPTDSTPLRGALSKAGQYFANKVTGQTDPMQYSCQKNFTILSTDGYWNTNDESSTYGPKRLDGTTDVDQQDGGTTARPYHDGSIYTETTVERWTVSSTWLRTTTVPVTKVGTSSTSVTTRTPKKGWTSTTYSLATTKSNASLTRCSSGSYSNGTCKITVKVTAGHGFATGDSVTIRGVGTPYDGTFSITKVSSTDYTYTLTGLSARPNSTSATGFSDPMNSGCAAGSGKQVATVETYDDVDAVATTTKVTTTQKLSTITIDRLSYTTPMTRTITVKNGQTQPDKITAGTQSSTTTARVSGPTTAPLPSPDGDPVPTSADTSATTPETTSKVLVRKTTASTCSTTASASTLVAGSPTTAGSQTNPTAPVTTGPTSTNGTTVVDNSAVVNTDGAKTSTASISTTGGSTNSLADVAMYYYMTDLRTSALGNQLGALGTDISLNNVSGIGADNENWQRMVTYTLSLGLSGTLAYDPNYETQAATGDYAMLKNGSREWPNPSNGGDAPNIDDLWHAAVNGRGKYFSANDADTLANSLSSALKEVVTKTGAGSSAATTTLQPVEGDRNIFIAQFKSPSWVGDLQAYKVNLQNGSIDKSTMDWSAAEQLSSSYVRTIYYFKKNASGFGGARGVFDAAALGTDTALAGNLANACGKAQPLTQCATLATADKTAANLATNMLSYLRGQPYSGYRSRTQILGDIVNSSPVYVSKPAQDYTENGYGTFKTTNRSAVVYVGANDGMLHAFDKDSGHELWAYVPALVIPNLYKLADSDLANKHEYYVDGSPKVSDIFVNGVWKTILVGGLNAGGRGYYALDVTDPANPLVLWEFTDDNLGYTFGNPVITKRASGKWVVAFTSGYNNVSPGDGKGYLYVLDAYTGVPAADVGDGTGKISTGAGDVTSPSGLGKLAAWVDSALDNTALRFYTGDLLGNVWRFDVDKLIEPKNGALKLATLTVGGKSQSITVRPQLAEVKSGGVRYAVVYVGTGRYLGTSDTAVTDTQSVYAIKDSLGATGLGDVVAGGTLVQQTLVGSQASTNNPVDWSVKNGWSVDLPTGGERVNVDMLLAFDTLVVPSNKPSAVATACSPGGGDSWLYYFDIANGHWTSTSMPTTMIAGVTAQVINKQLVVHVRTTDGTDLDPAFTPRSNSVGAARRTSWRELID